MKTYTAIIVLLAMLVGAGWVFNHVNAWIGVFLYLILTGALIYFCEDALKKHQRKMNRKNNSKTNQQ